MRRNRVLRRVRELRLGICLDRMDIESVAPLEHVACVVAESYSYSLG